MNFPNILAGVFIIAGFLLIVMAVIPVKRSDNTRALFAAVGAILAAIGALIAFAAPPS